MSGLDAVGKDGTLHIASTDLKWEQLLCNSHRSHSGRLPFTVRNAMTTMRLTKATPTLEIPAFPIMLMTCEPVSLHWAVASMPDY